MLTRSTIAIERPDNSIAVIYCHRDGYVSWNGKLLREFYHTPEAIEALINLGDISSLGDNLESSRASGRDRGESNTEARFFEDFNDYTSSDIFQDYNYIYRNGSWSVSEDDKMEWIPLDHFFNSNRKNRTMTQLAFDSIVQKYYR